jgi:hypothetical protein
LIPLDFIEIFSIQKFGHALLKVKISFCILSLLSAYSENNRKVFKRLWRIRGKYLAVFEEYAESI